MKRFLLALLLLPLAATSAPLSRAPAQACLDEVMRKGAPAVEAGPACASLLARIKAGADGVPGDKDLAVALGESGKEALRDFIATLPDAAAGSVRSRANPADVAAVLAALPDPAARPLSFWERVDAWLRRLLYPQRNEAGALPNWLLRLLEPLRHIPSVTVKATVWLLFATLFAGLVWVVVREVRAAGITLRRARKEPPAAIEAARVPAGQLQALPERERPAALLRWVIGRLVERGLLPADAALTNRELQTLLPAAVRLPFGTLVFFAERAYFGGIALDPAELDRAAELAQTLARQEALT